MKPATHRVNSVIETDTDHVQHGHEGKQPLWREVQVKHRKNLVGLNLDRMESEKTEVNQFDNCMLSPVQQKPKQKRPTISNFLKIMQVEIDQNQSRCEQDASSIISVNDIKYLDSFDIQSRCKGLRKSFIADTKFQMFLLLTAFKQSYNTAKQTISTFNTAHTQQLQNLTTYLKKLTQKYQTELTTKCHELKQLELNLRQHKIQSIEQKCQLEHKVTQLRDRNDQLQQQYQQIYRKYQEQQENNRTIQGFNRECNQVILSLHRKIEQLQQKQKMYKVNYETEVSKQLQKLRKQYQNLNDELRESYELKLKNVKVKMEKQLRNSTGSIPILFKQVDKQDETVSNANTMAMSQFSNVGGLGSVTQGQTKQGRETEQKQQYRHYHQIHQQSISSPKSIGSNKRFARTSKPDININNSNMNGTPLKKPLVINGKQSQPSCSPSAFAQKPQKSSASSLLTKSTSSFTFNKFSQIQNSKFLPSENNGTNQRNSSVVTANTMNSPKQSQTNNNFFSSTGTNHRQYNSNKNTCKNKDSMTSLMEMLPLQTIKSQISQILDDDEQPQAQVQTKNNKNKQMVVKQIDNKKEAVTNQRMKNIKKKQEINANGKHLTNTANTTSTANTRANNNNNNNNNINRISKNMVQIDSKLRETMN